MWLALGFFVAFATSVQDICVKQATDKMDKFVVMWAWWAFALPILLLMLFVFPVPKIQPGFWLILCLDTIILSFAVYFYVQALSEGDLSLSVPMLSFTPMFLLITSHVMLGEVVRPLGLLGMCFIFLGSYVLNFHKRKKGIFAPLKSLIDHKGPRYMLMVALLYSLGANFDKMATLRSSPHFWMLSLSITVSTALGIVMLIKCKGKIKTTVRKNWKALAVIGGFNAFSNLAQLTAVLLTLVPYLISIKRTSVIFSALYGFLVLKEDGLKERSVAISLMVMGVFCISLS